MADRLRTLRYRRLSWLTAMAKENYSRLGRSPGQMLKVITEYRNSQLESTSSGLRRIRMRSIKCSIPMLSFLRRQLLSGQARAKNVLVSTFEAQSKVRRLFRGTVVIPLSGGDLESDGTILRSVSSFFLIRRSSYFIDNPQELANVEHATSHQPNSTEFPFAIRDVPPGDYDFYAIFEDFTHGRVDRSSGHALVHVESQDVDDVRVLIQELQLSGHVTVSVFPQTSDRRIILPGSTVSLIPFSSIPTNLVNTVMTAQVNEKGDFVFRNLPQGRFVLGTVNIQSQAKNLAISDIRQGSRDLFFDDSVIVIGDDPPAPIEVAMGVSGSATIEAIVQTKGKPLALVLAPNPPRQPICSYIGDWFSEPLGQLLL